MGGDRVVDVGPLGLHGRTVNAPTRAMTGHAWRGACLDPRHAATEYGAIHFHRYDLEDAEWEPDFELAVPEEVTIGVYAVKLTAHDGAADVVPFIVRPPRAGATADVALVLPTLTYLAYANEQPPAPDSYASYRYPDGVALTPWDAWLVEHPELGTSLYDVHADGSGCCLSSRLRPIPALRPDHRASAFPAPRHLGADPLLVEWLERIGVAFDVLADEDVHRDGVDALGRYRVVLTGSHPEYVTGAMLDAFEGYVGGGGRLMYLGGNGFFWVTSLHSRGHLVEVRRGQTNQLPWDSRPGELHHATTGEPGGLWELRGRPARRLAGVGFTALGEAARPYVRTAAARDPRYAWVFDGLAADDVVGGGGLIFGDAGGYEVDRVDAALGWPRETVVLATAEGQGDEFDVLLSGGSHFVKPPVGTPPFARADLALLERPGGGAVFSVGSISWVGSLLGAAGTIPSRR